MPAEPAPARPGPATARGGRAAVLAVDGGNSKADAVLVGGDGGVLGAARRVQRSNVGRNGLDPVAGAVLAAAADAGMAPDAGLARAGVYCLAGADFPADVRRIGRDLGIRAWTERLLVLNDTFAVLRAGTDRGWGVAVVCGAGMNCAGVAPDGRTVRFPALGPLSGDLAAGGEWVGLAALAAAVRAGDGRGPRTALERLVPEHFGHRQAMTVSRAIHRGRLDGGRLVELPPVVFAAAGAGDAVARAILDRVADEVVAMATAAIRRLRLRRSDVDVVLGGGMFRSGDGPFLERVRAGVAETAPRAGVRPLRSPPVLGAALIGLAEVGASGRAMARLRASLTDLRVGGVPAAPGAREAVAEV